MPQWSLGFNSPHIFAMSCGQTEAYGSGGSCVRGELVKSLACLFIRSPVRDWAWLFLAINLLFTFYSGANPAARWTMMVAMAEDHSLRIDKYYFHTCDWSRTPDGHYYSNKAPGPSLIGYPLFWLLDRSDTSEIPTRALRDNIRTAVRENNLHTLAVFTQVIPFTLVTLLLIRELQKLGAPLAGLHIAAVALFFGNTASLFMNTYFGHSMAAMFVLFTLLSVHRRWAFRAGLFFGLAVMCDYADILLVLPLAIALAFKGLLRQRKLVAFLAGGAGPGLIFAAYHKICFGSPFTLSTKYVNPEFIDVPTNETAVWGVLRILPKTNILKKLLYSPERGIAYTQLWVLVAIVATLIVVGLRNSNYWERVTLRWVAMFGILSLSVMVWMNACFNGWHGGLTCGPRYLASTLPICALLIALTYSKIPSWVRQLYVVTLIPSLLLYVLVFACKDVLAPESPLHEFYFNATFAASPGPRLFRMSLIMLGMGWAAYRAYQSVSQSSLLRDGPE